MKMGSHVHHVVTGIPVDSCLHFLADLPGEAEILVAICQLPAQHPQEGFPELLSPRYSRVLLRWSMIENYFHSTTLYMSSFEWVSSGERKYYESYLVSSIYRFLDSASGIHITKNGHINMNEE